MDISRKKIWQQAAGDTDRNYAEFCLRWDVILNGPGNFGPWPDCAHLMQSSRPRKLNDLRRFALEMLPGDIVVLRLGTSTVLGVGEIEEGYEWHEEFGDIDGWDLQHVRRVRWFWKGDPPAPEFSTYDLKQGDTTQRLTSEKVIQWIANLPITSPPIVPPLIALPSMYGDREITLEQISEFLFDQGVSSASISNLTAEMAELTRIARWYEQSENRPSEHETIAYLAVPLLRALGWTPQRMAVEWNRVDIALFDNLPRKAESLSVVVEAKKMGNSCLSATSQAASYADGKLACLRLIVTDGLRYGVYVRDHSQNFKLHAYLNLTRLRSDYPILSCKGANHALLAMTPEWME